LILHFILRQYTTLPLPQQAWPTTVRGPACFLYMIAYPSIYKKMLPLVNPKLHVICHW